MSSENKKPINKPQKPPSMWAELGILVFGLAILYGAYLVLWEGKVPTRHANGFRSFDGIERIIGIVPLLFGGFVVYVILGQLVQRLKSALKAKKET